MDDPETRAVMAANLRFYDAFGSMDIQEMEKAWETSDRVLCVHPGWQPISGWEPVRESWQRIFENTTLMHFTITDARIVVHGDCAWVCCVENITSVVDGRASNFGVQATNVFVRGDDGWRMVHHHASG